MDETDVDEIDAGLPFIEQIAWLVGRLTEERHRLRARGAPAAELEANRLALLYWREQLADGVDEGKPAASVHEA